MNDLISKILHSIPQYLSDLFSIISGPKTFVAKHNRKPEKAQVGALLFFGVSVSIVVLLEGLIPPKEDLWSLLLKEVARWGIAACLLPGALMVAWRLVGGKSSFKGNFVTLLYFLSVMILVANVALLIGLGAFQSFADGADESKHPTLVALLVLWVVVIVGGVLTWFFTICWGAFRQLNKLSKARSFVALLIFLPLAFVVVLIAEFLGNGMNLPNLEQIKPQVESTPTP